MAALLVVTEHRTFLTPERRQHYERIRRRLEDVAGTRVDSALYSELDELESVECVVLSGSFAPWAAHDPGALERLGEVVRRFEGPVLGICAGMQLQALFAGGSVGRAASAPENGYREIDVLDAGDLLRGLPRKPTLYQHHTDEITVLPADFRVLASSRECRVEAIADPGRRWWGTQFHPEEFEPAHPAGERVLHNFFALATA